MAENVPKILEKGFQNWLKANLALNITKDGIEDAVFNVINTFHQDALNAILTPDQLLNKEFCSQCIKENVLQCPTRGICVVKLGMCSFHDSKHSRPCPKRVCDRIRDKIKTCHIFNLPSWKNTRTEKWCENPWELAKCYFPPDGYIDIDTIAETDVNAILSLLMNHAIFKNKVDEKACKKIRDIGRIIRHSPNLSIDDNDLCTFLDTLVTFLNDSSLLQADLNVAASVQKLKELNAESLLITTNDVTRVLLDVIQENTHGSLKQINETTAQRVGEVKAGLDKLEATASKSLKDILTAKAAAISDIEGTKETAKEELKSSAEVLKSDLKEDIYRRQQAAVSSIKHTEQSSIKKLEKAASDISKPLERLTEADYQLLKNELKKDLLSFNRANHSIMPLSPLIGEDDTKLIGFYVLPALSTVEVQKTEFRGPASEVKTPVSSLKDVFYKNSNRCKNVILTSEAGQGKTVFCKRLALIWYNAHHTDEGEFSDEDLNIMRKFDYLFLILLRDSTGADCEIDDMIQNQIIQCFSQSDRYSKDLLQTVLTRESSLILLDGLDEWSHPEQKKSTCRRSLELFPHRKAREKCTIMTSTRSWKFSIANMKSSEIDNCIEIGVLEDKSSTQLIKHTLTKIKECRNISDDVERNVENISADIRSGSIEEFTENPLLLTYLICLWCDGKPLGQSRCEVYTDILELLLFRAAEKHAGMIIKEFSLDAKDTVTFPECFESRYQTKSCYKVIILLGKLAFQGLFNKNKEKSLVFDQALVDDILSPEAYKFSLFAGLLTRGKVPKKLTSRDIRISFSHKTFQEFFAALYIQSRSDLSGISAQVLGRCNSVATILEMSNVFIFLSGLSAENVSFLSGELQNCVNKDEMTISYRREVYDQVSIRRIKDLQNMYITCLNESRNNDIKSLNSLNSLNLVLEDIVLDMNCRDERYSHLLQRLVLMNIKNIKSVQYSGSVSEEATRKTIGMFHLTDIHTFETLYLVCPIMPDDLETLLTGSVDTLKQVSLRGHILRDGRYKRKCNILTDISISSLLRLNRLESLELDGIKVSHIQLESLTSFLTQRTSMKEICLFDIACTDHGQRCNGFNMDLSQHSQLKIVGFGEITLSLLKINISKLETCSLGELQNENILSSCLCNLQSASKLKHFNCAGPTTGLDLVLHTIPLLVRLQVIVISDSDMRNKSFQLSTGMVNIEAVIIHNTSMTSASLSKLVHDVTQYQQSVVVELLECIVSPTAEYKKIKKYIRTSEKFMVLIDGKARDTLGRKANAFQFKTH